jgi:phosphoglycerol transferase MdoB-like AlkP superfamily enzyme
MLSSYIQYFKSIRIKGNIYTSLVLNLLVVYFAFTLSRVVFFVFNREYFGSIESGRLFTMLMGGLKFDTSAILYTNILYLMAMLIPLSFRYGSIYQTVLKWVFIVSNSIALAANSADIIYFRFTLRRTTASIFNEFENEVNIIPLILKFLVDYWYILAVWAALVAIVVFAYRKPKAYVLPSGPAQHAWYFANGLIIMALALGLTVAGLRGGFRHSTRPITLSNAGEYVKEPLETAIVLNTPFSIYRTIGFKGLQNVQYFASNEELESIYTPVHTPIPQSEFKPLNVVVIIMESVGREYIGAYNSHLKEQGYTSFTPFLDSLIGESFMFRYSFSNGRKSIDVLPSVFTSIPMIVEPFVLTPYSSNKLNSMATLLKGKGYYSAFFHGAPNGSMGHQAFTTMHGFDRYYGMTEYGNDKDFDGMWGIWDEEFFQFFAKKMNELPQPFLSGIFSVTSHHPFRIPSRYEGKFPKGTLPIHQCIGYTDFALKRFYNAVKQEPWFANTLFVFTSDHANEPAYDEYRTNLGVYTVPIFFHYPAGNLKGVSTLPAQQIDILPTVLQYLNFDKPYVTFGKNLFNPNAKPFAISYSNSTYQLVYNNYFMLFDGEKPLSMFNYRTDSLFKRNILAESVEEANGMNIFIKAFIQQYNMRLINDRLVVPEELVGNPKDSAK